jgi:hypothetical protein
VINSSSVFDSVILRDFSDIFESFGRLDAFHVAAFWPTFEKPADQNQIILPPLYPHASQPIREPLISFFPNFSTRIS